MTTETSPGKRMRAEHKSTKADIDIDAACFMSLVVYTMAELSRGSRQVPVHEAVQVKCRDWKDENEKQ